MIATPSVDPSRHPGPNYPTLKVDESIARFFLVSHTLALPHIVGTFLCSPATRLAGRYQSQISNSISPFFTLFIVRPMLLNEINRCSAVWNGLLLFQHQTGTYSFTSILPQPDVFLPPKHRIRTRSCLPLPL